MFIRLFLFFLFVNSAAYAADFKFLFPVHCDLGTSCWIMNYMDAAGNDVRAQDYMCGPRTYNTHTGIDIALRDLRAAYDGVPVIAPADGRVVYVRNDVADQVYQPGTRSPACGNGLVILHESGWETRFCHLKQDSLMLTKGDRVTRGQVIGAIGLSGATSWPHLAFSVLRKCKFHDPFSGRLAAEGCGLTPKALWETEQPYHPFSVFNVGFSDAVPDQSAIDLGATPKPKILPVSTQALYFWSYAFGMQPSDVVTLILYGPDGQELTTERITIEQAEPKSFFTIHHDRGNGIFEPGIYTGYIRLERGAGNGKKVNEWKRLVELVQAEN